MADLTINGDRLKRRRIAAGLTLRGLSERCAELEGAISHTQLAEYESGKALLPRQPKVLRAIAVALGTSTDYLLGETDDPRPDRVPAGQR